MVLLNSTVFFLNSEISLTNPSYKPSTDMDCIELKKLRKFPINANPSAPINTAIAFDVKIPATILVKTEAVFNDPTLTNTLLFI